MRIRVWFGVALIPLFFVCASICWIFIRMSCRDFAGTVLIPLAASLCMRTGSKEAGKKYTGPSWAVEIMEDIAAVYG